MLTTPHQKLIRTNVKTLPSVRSQHLKIKTTYEEYNSRNTHACSIPIERLPTFKYHALEDEINQQLFCSYKQVHNLQINRLDKYLKEFVGDSMTAASALPGEMHFDLISTNLSLQARNIFNLIID